MPTTTFKNTIRATGGFATGAVLETKTVTSTGATTTGSATLNTMAGKITTPSLTTAALATHTLTLTNSKIAAADTVMVSVAQGTNTAGTPLLRSVVPSAGSVAILLENIHATNAYNGTFVISFVVFKV